MALTGTGPTCKPTPTAAPAAALLTHSYFCLVFTHPLANGGPGKANKLYAAAPGALTTAARVNLANLLPPLCPRAHRTLRGNLIPLLLHFSIPLLVQIPIPLLLHLQMGLILAAMPHALTQGTAA